MFPEFLWCATKTLLALSVAGAAGEGTSTWNLVANLLSCHPNEPSEVITLENIHSDRLPYLKRSPSGGAGQPERPLLASG